MLREHSNFQTCRILEIGTRFSLQVCELSEQYHIVRGLLQFEVRTFVLISVQSFRERVNPPGVSRHELKVYNTISKRNSRSGSMLRGTQHKTMTEGLMSVM